MTASAILRAARRRARARRGERGAVLVEVVLIVPVLLIISLGVFDIGLSWKASLTVSNASRAGARVASNIGIGATADKAALSSIAASLGTIPASEIDVVVIYRTTTPTGAVPAGCLDSVAKLAGGNLVLQCNTYSASDINGAATSSAFTGVCATSRDRFWCPSTRANNQALSAGPDYIGVFVRINHATKTKMFGSTMVIKDTAVMRIEPNAGNP